MFISFYTSRIVLNALGAENYGIYNVVGGVIGMLSFLNGSMSLATGRYFAYAIGKNDYDLLSRTYSASIILHLCVSVVVIIIAETLGLWYFYNYLNIPESSYSNAMWVYQVSVISSFVGINSVPIVSLVSSHEDMQAYAYIGLLEGLLKLGVAFMLTLGIIDNLKSYAIAMFISSFIILIIWYTYSRCKYGFCKFVKKIDKSILKDIYGFVTWQLVGSISWVLRNQGVNLVLNYFFGPLLNTARALALQVNGGITSAFSAFQTATNPQIVKHYAMGDLGSMHGLIFMSSKLAFLMLFVFAFPVMVEIQPILQFWLGKVPEYATVFVQLMILATLVDSLSGTLQQAALATGKIRRYTGIVTIILLSDIIWVIIAFKMGMPPQSMLYIESIIYFVAFMARLYILRNMINLSAKKFLRYVTVPEIIVVIISTAILLILTLLHFQILNIFIRLVILFIIASLISFFVGLNTFERRWTFILIKKKIIRK